MRTKAILVTVAGISLVLASLYVYLYRAQDAVRRENRVLRMQSTQLSRLAADNQQLSNSLAQAGRAQAAANDQLQELIRLRAEVSRLRDDQESTSTRTETAAEIAGELATLRSEVDRLIQVNDELEQLREEMQQVRAADLSALAEDLSAGTEEAADELDRLLAVRVIRTQVDTFPAKLKQSVAARDDESFQDVFGRFLQTYGVETNGVAGAVFDERTGSVIVRATPAALDQVERVTSALNQEP